PELQHRPLRREHERSAGRVRPSWELVDLQLALEEARLELLGRRLADLLSVRTQVSVDPRAASVNVVLSAGLHSQHGVRTLLSVAAVSLVPGAGIEPARRFRRRGILSALCLPISPPGR